MKSLLCLVASLFASVAAACPPVAVSNFSVQSLGVACCPSVAVQSFAVAQPVQVQSFAFAAAPVVQAQAVAFAPVYAQAFAVQSQALAVCPSGGCSSGRAGILGRRGGGRSRSVSKAVSVQRSR